MKTDIWALADAEAAAAYEEKWIEQELKERFPEEFCTFNYEWIEDLLS